ncbi:MAG: hypothetical protein JSU96_02280 [Acidobacteriota bacterium]|nr:MAG: hypothetical protein JSU96_02280 [Acidobacteriota bacterium]
MCRFFVRSIVLVLLLGCVCGSLLAQPDTYRVAYDSGRVAGEQAGRADQEGAAPFDFANKVDYQTALNGFDASIHDRDVYMVAFRRGFEDGYEVGYGLGQEKKTLSAPPPVVVDDPIPSYPTGGRIIVPSGTEIEVRLLETLSTKRNERGDDFRAEVMRDIEINGEIAIPAGSRVNGTITHLKQAGRIKGRAEMNLSFNEIEPRGGLAFPIQGTVASIEDRADERVKDDEGTLEGPASKGEDGKRVAKTTGIGALLGVLTGGGRGAKIGAAVGAVAGIAGILATRGQDMVIPSETELVIRLDADASVPTGLLRP